MINEIMNFESTLIHNGAPKMMSQADVIYEATGLPGLILYFGIQIALIILLIWVRYQIYVWDKNNPGKEFFPEFRKEEVDQ